MELEVTPDPMYELICRGLSNVPLLSQLQITYRGREASIGCTNAPATTGEVHTTSLVKLPGKKLGLKMAGAYELGGVFVTDVNPSGVAAAEQRLQVGCRILEVNYKSVVFETQDSVGRIIRDSTGDEISITFQVLSTLEWSKVCNHSAQDDAFKYLAKAHEIRRMGAKKFKEAIAYYQSALKCESKDTMLRCQVLSGLGTMYFAMRQFPSSAKYHALEVKAVEACPDFNNKFALCRALDNLGLAYRYCGSLDYAISVYKKELEYAKGARNTTTKGRAYANLGITYGMKKQYSKAIAYHEKSLAAATDDNDRAAEGRSHGNLGVSYGLMKKYDTAIKHHKQRLAIAVELNEENTQYRALGNICTALKQKGDTLNAKEYWDRQQLLRPPSATAASGSETDSSSRPASTDPTPRPPSASSISSTNGDATPDPSTAVQVDATATATATSTAAATSVAQDNQTSVPVTPATASAAESAVPATDTESLPTAETFVAAGNQPINTGNAASLDTPQVTTISTNTIQSTATPDITNTPDTVTGMITDATDTTHATTAVTTTDTANTTDTADATITVTSSASNDTAVNTADTVTTAVSATSSSTPRDGFEEVDLSQTIQATPQEVAADSRPSTSSAFVEGDTTTTNGLARDDSAVTTNMVQPEQVVDGAARDGASAVPNTTVVSSDPFSMGNVVDSRANSVSSSNYDTAEETMSHRADVASLKNMSRHSSAGSIASVTSTTSVTSSGLRFDDAVASGGYGRRQKSSGRESLSSQGSLSDISDGPVDAFVRRPSSLSPGLPDHDAPNDSVADDARATLGAGASGDANNRRSRETPRPFAATSGDFAITSATSLDDFMG